MKIAVFPCIGLGDGLISCVLAQNLMKAGHTIDVFHPILPTMQPLFPYLSFFPRPMDLHILHGYDKTIFFYEKLEWMQTAMQFSPEKNCILNPIATPHRDYPFWEEGEFDGTLPFVENLIRYVEKKWGVEKATRDIGIQLPEYVQRNKYPNRIILHPTSSRKGKNWSKEKFLSLAKRLQKEGYEPVCILTKEEQKIWPEMQVPSFSDLCEVAAFIAESGVMMGNDSGIGHLASVLGIPTLTICRSKMSADFWRPSWTMGEVVIPPNWIPNIKGLRLRDKRWQTFVSVNKVYKRFLQLCEASKLCH